MVHLSNSYLFLPPNPNRSSLEAFSIAILVSLTIKMSNLLISFEKGRNFALLVCCSEIAFRNYLSNIFH